MNIIASNNLRPGSPSVIVKDFLNADDTSVIDHLEMCINTFERMGDANSVGVEE